MHDELDQTDDKQPQSEQTDAPPVDEMPAEEAPLVDEPIEDAPAAEPKGDESEVADDVAPTEGADEFTADAAPEDEVAAITASLEEPIPAGESADAVGPADAVVAADGDVPAEETAPAEGTADATLDAAAPAPALMDLGPEKRTAWWAWVLGVLGVIAVGVVGWALWYYFLSPVTVPRVVGKDVGQAAQSLNDAKVRLGRTSEVPTSTAPPGTVIEQTPAAGTEVERDVEVSLVVAAPPTTSAVPDVKGLKLEDAQKTLAGEELGTSIVETYESVTAAGFVVSQLPTAGAELPPGALVAVVVSRGPSPTTATVPDLRGITTEEAQKVLSALDLVPAAYKSNDASVPAGQIATQSPVPGTRVTTRTSVMYLVSDGRALNPVTVPDVVNDQSKAAVADIKAAGLVAKTRTVSHPSVATGNVIGQMPLPGAKVAKGSSVGLLISRGPSEQLAVPSLVGTDSASAEKAIAAAGFKAVMLPSPLAEGTPGQVISQWPAAGAQWPQYLPVIALFRQQ